MLKTVLEIAAGIAAVLGLRPLVIVIEKVIEVIDWLPKVMRPKELPLEELWKVRYDMCVAALEKGAKNCQPQIQPCIQEVFTDYGNHVVAIIHAGQTPIVLGGRSEQEAQELKKRLSIWEQDLGAVQETLSRILGRPLEDRLEILRKPCVFDAKDQDRLRRLLVAIFTEAQASSGLAIVDGVFHQRAFKELLAVPEATPIRIITWAEPSSNTTSEIFIERLYELQERRSGSVSVLTPRTLSGAEAPNDPLPSGCWLFTDMGAYEFDRPLWEVFSCGNAIHFTPHEGSDVAELRERLFLRWWSGKVNGYQCVQVL